jgi:coiled-coil domain-containing protein 55
MRHEQDAWQPHLATMTMTTIIAMSVVAITGNGANLKPIPLVRTGAASSTNRMAQAAQSAALAEDAAAFEYDSLYDSMKAKQKAASKAARKDASREPKYIKQLLAKAEERKRDDELYYEKKLLREQAEEMEEFGETEKFLTSAYRKKMEENRLWREEKERRDAEIDAGGIASKGSASMLANIINGRLADDDDDDDEKKQPTSAAVQKNATPIEEKEETNASTTATAATATATAATAASTHVALVVASKKRTVDGAADLDVNQDVKQSKDNAADAPERRDTQGWTAATVGDKSLAERQKEALTIDTRHDDNSKLSARERYLARKKQRSDGGTAAAGDDQQ